MRKVLTENLIYRRFFVFFSTLDTYIFNSITRLASVELVNRKLFIASYANLISDRFIKKVVPTHLGKSLVSLRAILNEIRRDLQSALRLDDRLSF